MFEGGAASGGVVLGARPVHAQPCPRTGRPAGRRLSGGKHQRRLGAVRQARRRRRRGPPICVFETNRRGPEAGKGKVKVKVKVRMHLRFLAHGTGHTTPTNRTAAPNTPQQATRRKKPQKRLSLPEGQARRDPSRLPACHRRRRARQTNTAASPHPHPAAPEADSEPGRRLA